MGHPHDPAALSALLPAGLDLSAAPPEGRAVLSTILARRSVRGFLPDPVPRETVEAILAVASRAPSGSNIQPWKVHVCAGPVRDAICADVLAAHDAEAGDPAAGEQYRDEYRYYPEKWRDPYLARRRDLGWALYGAVGIARGENDKMHRQRGRNFSFFGAPVGLVFTLDRDLSVGSWIDLGMFMQNAMIAARAYGLETCPQQAFARYHRILRQHLAIPDDQIVVCAMALGHPDPDEPANRLVSTREPVAAFGSFHGF
ncbi:nitroreductase [Oryzomicrobium sp.]|uniref:nitroreductase n=1 Tax=Oryzomicrobium sp. TaxID=1911578 RepID=UPI0025F8F9AD|nr:nitroreductase [Oryzomicrobium sp.]MCE1243824.1 nitroreductase [Oryzomicrobium sp.]